MCLAAIVDWYYRKVHACRLSKSMDSQFCVDRLQKAIFKYAMLEIFNTDQGGQFFGQGFISKLKK